MYRLLICACFVGALTSLCESAELEKIDLLTVPEGIRELANETAPEVIWQHAFQEENGIDIQTGMSEDCWLLMGLNSKQSRVYVWYRPYADSPEVGTEISFGQMPDVVREAVKSDRPEMIPTVVYAVRESTRTAADTYYHVQGEPRGGETMLARFNSKGQLRQTNLVIPAYPKDRFQTVTSAAGRFTADMPGKAQEVVEEFTRPADKAQFKIHRFVVATGADTGYLIFYFDWPDSDVKGIEPQRLLQAFLKGDLKPTDKVVEEREITLDTDNIPGRYFLIQSSPQVFSREQVYLSGNRLYRVKAIDTKESVASDDANRFFNSFAIPKATEPVHRDTFGDWLTRKLRDEAMALKDDAIVEPEFHEPTGANP